MKSGGIEDDDEDERGTAGFYNDWDRFIHCDEGAEQVTK